MRILVSERQRSGGNHPLQPVPGWKRGDYTMKDDQKPTRTEPQARKEEQPAQNRKKEQKKSDQTRS